MPILKTTRAPNGVTVSYHRLGAVEGRFPDLTVQVQSWVDREAYLQGLPPSFNFYAPFDARGLLGQFEQAALAVQDLAGGTVEVDGDTDLAAAQVRRWAKLKQERDALDFAPISHADFEIDADQQARLDIMGAIMAMQAAGQSTRLWRCSDNQMRELSLSDLLAVGTAIAARRQHLIETSDALWQQLQAAQTVEEVEAVAWPAG